MQVQDRLTLDASRRTKDGYLKARARVARTGIYDYTGFEVDPENRHGLRDKAVVKVYRPGDQVFDQSSLASFVGKPITDNHPSAPVTADNWRDHARGTVMGAIRDGEYVAFDLMLTDKRAIAAVEAGKRELSNGYATDLKIEPGTAPDGTAYDAVQTSIVGNHIALVDRGRAGPDCRISDAFAVCDANPARVAELSTIEEPVKMAGTITVDGLPVSLADEAAVRAVIDKMQAQITDAETQLATITTDKANLEAEKATLEKQLADAKLTPAQLRDAAQSFVRTCDKAKTLGVTITDSMDEPAIMAAAVNAKIGDVAKDWTDAQIAASFATLSADAKPEVQNLNTTRTVSQDAGNAVAILRAARYA